MDSPRGLGIVRVALTLQVTLAPEKLEALLRESDKELGAVLAARVDAWVQEHRTGYYPALDFLAGQEAIRQDEFEALRSLAATIRKRIKRDVQTTLWPVFSSVHLERSQSLCFLLPHVKPGRADSVTELAQHYFPNTVRIDLVLATLDKTHRLEEAVKMTEQKVLRNLGADFTNVSVSGSRLVNSDSPH